MSESVKSVHTRTLPQDIQTSTNAVEHREHDMAVLPTKNQPTKIRTVAKSTELLLESDIDYLIALIETKGDRNTAMLRAGYTPANADALRAQHSQIMRRIDSVDEVSGLLKAIGLGQSKLILELAWMYEQKNVRFMGVAIKLHAELLGLNTPQQSSGTPINVNVMQSNVAAPGNALTPNPGFVRVTIDQQKPLPQQINHNKVCNEEDDS